MTTSQRIKTTRTTSGNKRSVRSRSISVSRRLGRIVANRSTRLKQSLEREKILGDMVRSASIAIDIAYPDGHVSHCNPAFFDLVGYTDEELPNINWIKLTPPEFHAFEERKLEEVRRTGKTVRYEKEYFRKDGSRVPIELLVQPKYDKKGSFEGYFGFISDITQRKRMEEQLREARDRIDRVVTMNPAAIYLAKPAPDYSDILCIYISQSVKFVTGFGPEAYIGETAPEFWKSRVPQDDQDAYFKDLPLLWQNDHHTFEYRFRHKDGTYRWVREESNVIRKGRGIEVIGYLSDITEARNLEQKLLRSERLATIGELAAMVGHDLRNPLQSIAGATYFLEKKLRSRTDPMRSNEEREMIETIKSAIKYSNSILTDLFEYSKELNLQLEWITLKKLVEDSLGTLEIPENVKTVEMTEDVTVKVDIARMQRALTNLIENAVDAMPKGGKITIEGTRLKGVVELTVADTGTGIPKDQLEKIWLPLYTTKSKGIGLGLAIAKRVAEAHDGSVHAESIVGHGSRFTISIPVDPGQVD